MACRPLDGPEVRGTGGRTTAERPGDDHPSRAADIREHLVRRLVGLHHARHARRWGQLEGDVELHEARGLFEDVLGLLARLEVRDRLATDRASELRVAGE